MIPGLKEFYNYNFGKNAVLSDTEFLLYATKAVAELDRISDGKFSQLTDAECDADCKKLCVCEVAERIFERERTENISSENNDGYSVTYKSDSATVFSTYEIAKRYLGKTGILYRGYDDDNK